MLLSAASAGLAAGAGLIVAIGSQNAFVLRQGLLRRHVGLVVVTCILGDMALIACGTAGMGALVRQWPVLLQALRFGGAAFLGAYAVLAARRAWQGSGGLAPGVDAEGGRRATLLACLAFTFLNPHVYLDTVLLVGSLSGAYEGAARTSFAIGAISASFLWFFGLGYGARLLEPLFARPASWRVLDTLIGLVMAVLGLNLLMRLV